MLSLTMTFVSELSRLAIIRSKMRMFWFLTFRVNVLLQWSVMISAFNQTSVVFKEYVTGQTPVAGMEPLAEFTATSVFECGRLCWNNGDNAGCTGFLYQSQTCDDNSNSPDSLSADCQLLHFPDVNFLSFEPANSSCQEQFYVSTSAAMCDANCAGTCDVRGPGKCDAQCRPGLFLSTNFTCESCDANCTGSCDVQGPGKCDAQCRNGSVLTSQHTCELCDVNCAGTCDVRGPGKCDAQCRPGLFLSTNFTCESCDVKCVGGCNITGPGKCDDTCEFGWLLSPQYNCKSNVLQGTAAAMSVATYNDFLLFSRTTQQITIYNSTTLQEIRNVTIAGSNSPFYGMAPSPVDNLLYLSQVNGNKVRVVKWPLPTANDAIVPTSNFSVQDTPIRLSVNRANNVLVVNYRYIDECKSNGTRVRRLSSSAYIRHAVEQLNGAIAVSTFATDFFGDLHAVLLMSASGVVLKRYGNATKGSGAGQLNTPQGLAVDKEGFVLVCDFGNNRVLVLNPTLSEARLLPTTLTKTINGPSAIWLDQAKGRLYVCEAHSPFRILVYENMFNISKAFNWMKPVQ